MILRKNHSFPKTLICFVLLFILAFPSLAQEQKGVQSAGVSPVTSFRQDTAMEIRMRNAITASEPDTNFTWEKYADFLIKISDTSKYIVLPVNEFRTTANKNKIVVGLRHDLDNDLNHAYAFSETEYKLGVRSTYYILHTAPYYLANSTDMSLHSESIIPILKSMQNERHFEIGWHNDLVTLQLIFKIDPYTFLKNELAWLRSNGINIYGSAAHGSNFCKTYLYMNYYFFNECTYPIVPTRPNNITVPMGGNLVPIVKGNMADFDLKYEAYFLDFNKYFSDATITNGIRWDIGKLNINDLKPGDRVMILLHPFHWHKGAVNSDIQSFRIPGQKSSYVNQNKSIVSVIMPHGSKLNSLVAIYSLGPGAYAKVNKHQQVSGSDWNDFRDTVSYMVYAENRNVVKEWKVIVKEAKNSECAFESFEIEGLTKSVNINKPNRTIFLKVSELADLKKLTPHFRLSSGASAWIENNEQKSSAGSLDFTNQVHYKVVAEDKVYIGNWTITVEKEQNQANFISFNLPGMKGREIIDTLYNRIYAEVEAESGLSSIPVSFVVSDRARAYQGTSEVLSGASIDFSVPVLINVVSQDENRTKTWTVTVRNSVVSDYESAGSARRILVYPNPSSGLIHLKSETSYSIPVKLVVTDIFGRIVFTKIMAPTGPISEDIDLSSLGAGIYMLRYSDTEKPVRIILLSH
jgi:hypothetical protein